MFKQGFVTPARTVLCSILLTGGASAAVADSYRAEVAGGYNRGSLDGSVGYSVDPGYTPPDPGAPDPGTGAPAIEPLSYGDDDYDGFFVAGEVFLSDVDTSKGPLKLAPFLDRASSVGGAYGTLETDDTDVETTLWQVNGRFVTGSGWVFAGAYGAREVEVVGTDSDADIYEFSVGKYLADATELSVGFTREDDDAFELDRFLVMLTHVQNMENGQTWSVVAEAAWVTSDTAFGDDDGWDLFVEATWFPRDNLAFGLDLQFSDRDESGDLNSYELYANYFLTEKISLNLSYAKTELYGGVDAEQDAVTFEARYRF